MTETNANAIYKVGDKVRILNAEAIVACAAKDGDVLRVTAVSYDGRPYLMDVDGVELSMRTKELRYIEKVADKPTKNQRISALESEVSALKAAVEALKQAQSKPSKLCILAVDPSVTNVAPIPTPNELRKAIIAEARAFVADTATFINTDYSWHSTHIPLHASAGTLRVKFEVNAKKRTVVALVYLKFMGALRTKAIAKCAPGDVFNADIGKAIALGRALGLDVSKFEQAVQPTEVVVGHVVKRVNRYGDSLGEMFVEKVRKLEPDEYRTYSTNTHEVNGGHGYGTGHGDSITDDTEAQYE